MQVGIREVLEWYVENVHPSKVKSVAVSLIELRALVAEVDALRSAQRSRAIPCGDYCKTDLAPRMIPPQDRGEARHD